MVKKNIIGAGIPQYIFKELKENFDQEVFEFVNFSSAQKLILSVKKYKVSLIFIYNALADLKNCEELCITLRSISAIETIPIIVICYKDTNQKEKIKLLKSGLIDGYITWPVSIEEIVAYGSAFLQRQILQEELESKNKLLSRISISDELTKLYNRRYLIQRLEEEIKRMKRYHYPLSCMMIDIDYFKKVNDKYGHAQGDAVLKETARFLNKNIRSVDIPCRYGGDEIVIILPHTNFAGTSVVAERLRKMIEEYNFAKTHKPLGLTASIGLLTFDSKDEVNLDSLIQTLDKQLYKAKSTGRNKICGGLYRNLK